ncbi:MAG: DNA-processing protein DprA [Patescibacteria group bacterium]|nr:DNA-processing protein DprA [Patescibacteria group bacterium]
MKSDFLPDQLAGIFPDQLSSELSDDQISNFYLYFLSQIKGLGQTSLWRYLSQGKNQVKIKKLAQSQAENKSFLKETYKQFIALKEPYISILDSRYPKQLKNIYDPPLFLFYQGDISLASSAYLLTIVGSRTLDSYHCSALKKIIATLADTPLIVVSGLALGIDSLGHQAALVNNLKTIAVLGSGLDQSVFYPQSNFRLGQDILGKGGLLLSEYPQKTKASLHHFPCRNRILAGLSPITLVVSGTTRSGTLITAQIALDEGRQVWTLPGNIDQRLCQGPNQLIKNGAELVLSGQDILDAYQIKKEIISEKINFKEKIHAQSYSLLQTESMTLVELAARLKKPLPEINAAVSQMEIQGLVRINQFNQVEIK